MTHMPGETGNGVSYEIIRKNILGFDAGCICSSLRKQKEIGRAI